MVKLYLAHYYRSRISKIMHLIEIVMLVVAVQAIYFWSIFGYWTVQLTRLGSSKSHQIERIGELKQKQRIAFVRCMFSFGVILIFIVSMMLLMHYGFIV